MSKPGSTTQAFYTEMQEDLFRLAKFSNDYGPQSPREAIERTQAALKDMLIGISRNRTAEAEEGQFDLESVIEEPAEFFGQGKYAEEHINLKSLKPETIALIIKAVLMQLCASDGTKFE